MLTLLILPKHRIIHCLGLTFWPCQSEQINANQKRNSKLNHKCHCLLSNYIKKSILLWCTCYFSSVIVYYSNCLFVSSYCSQLQWGDGGILMSVCITFNPNINLGKRKDNHCKLFYHDKFIHIAMKFRGNIALDTLYNYVTFLTHLKY